ncbi:phage tail assembly protein [Agrobacterium genomosp. 13]|uniref:Uncharacterized protein n=1 Tax=Agrobacterium genomosp. 13 str. CFBP 6927 TaxID=1183428 RepID=A0ABP2BKH1_9HYPH|nr:phage tail assembly protein [Agrobacterium genomosp. 13]CUX31892.1 hypothetical protein AGR13a_Cc30157 [Agrobacterium genomosp. 13 str. CFBP 6927]
MKTISLSQPLLLDGSVSVDRIVVRKPSAGCLKGMRNSRNSVAGFTYSQVIWFCCRMTCYGEVALRNLSAADFAELSRAIEEIYQACQGEIFLESENGKAILDRGNGERPDATD